MLHKYKCLNNYNDLVLSYLLHMVIIKIIYTGGYKFKTYMICFELVYDVRFYTS